MSLPTDWAAPEDLATFFQYSWHRDFPMGEGAIGARHTVWTKHTGGWSSGPLVTSRAQNASFYAFQASHTGGLRLCQSVDCS